MSETTLDVPDWIWQRIEYWIAMLGETLNDPDRPRLPLNADDWQIMGTTYQGDDGLFEAPEGRGWWLVSSDSTSLPHPTHKDELTTRVACVWARRINKTVDKENLS